MQTSDCVVLLSDGARRKNGEQIKLADTYVEGEKSDEISWECQKFERYMMDGSSISASMNHSACCNDSKHVRVEVQLPVGEEATVEALTARIAEWITQLLPQQITLSDGVSGEEILKALILSDRADITKTDFAGETQPVLDSQENSMDPKIEALQKENAELKAQIADQDAAKAALEVRVKTLEVSNTKLADLEGKIEILMSDNQTLHKTVSDRDRLRAEIDLKTRINACKGLTGEAAELVLDDGFISALAKLGGVEVGEYKLADGNSARFVDTLMKVLESIPVPDELTETGTEEQLHDRNASKKNSEDRTYSVNYQKESHKQSADVLNNVWEVL
jgi:hypothetical protein